MSFWSHAKGDSKKHGKANIFVGWTFHRAAWVQESAKGETRLRWRNEAGLGHCGWVRCVVPGSMCFKTGHQFGSVWSDSTVNAATTKICRCVAHEVAEAESWLQVDRRVTEDAQTSLDALAAFSLAQMAQMQGRWSRHVVGRRGSVQTLRRPAKCQYLNLRHASAGRRLTTPTRDNRIQAILNWTLLRLTTADIAAEAGVGGKKLKIKVSVNHNTGWSQQWKDRRMSQRTCSGSFVMSCRGGVLVCTF